MARSNIPHGPNQANNPKLGSLNARPHAATAPREAGIRGREEKRKR
jgi:hypothetical protein